MKKILCKLFGHRWTYYITGNTPQNHIRHCKWCNRAQQYKALYLPGKTEMGWMYLVQRTDKGAKDFIKDLKVDF